MLKMILKGWAEFQLVKVDWREGRQGEVILRVVLITYMNYRDIFEIDLQMSALLLSKSWFRLENNSRPKGLI